MRRSRYSDDAGSAGLAPQRPSGSSQRALSMRPVMNGAAGSTRKRSTASKPSSESGCCALARRLAGTGRSPASAGPAAITGSMNRVAIAPGATALTCMPCGASSLATVSVSATTAAFEQV